MINKGGLKCCRDSKTVIRIEIRPTFHDLWDPCVYVTWTAENKMLSNPDKSSYTVFSRGKGGFVTGLTGNGRKIEQKAAGKFLGCWIDEDAGK